MVTDIPKLEVVIFTYNHASFVGRALASVLAQDIDLPFSIRVHDDASTDGTVEVIRAALAGTEVPWKLVQAGTNRYQEGTSFYHEFIAASTSEYVAILDGDDYWIDDSKLDQQVRLLDRIPSAALCHHPVLELAGDELRPVDWPPGSFRDEKMPGLRLSAQNVISSSSVLVRRSMFPTEMPVGYNKLGIGDYPMWALASAGNDIAFIDRAMSVYRVHESNIFASQNLDTKLDRELEARIYISNNVPEEFRSTWRRGIADSITYYREVAELVATKNELAERTIELAVVRREIANLKESTSWRLTSPLRAAAGLLQRRTDG